MDPFYFLYPVPEWFLAYVEVNNLVMAVPISPRLGQVQVSVGKKTIDSKGLVSRRYDGAAFTSQYLVSNVGRIRFVFFFFFSDALQSSLPDSESLGGRVRTVRTWTVRNVSDRLSRGEIIAYTRVNRVKQQQQQSLSGHLSTRIYIPSLGKTCLLPGYTLELPSWL